MNPSARPPRWAPSVTVAAIIERDGRFLLVEEHTPEGLRLNNPAGHLEQGESPLQAVCREALEETARVFEPSHLLGVYLSRFRRPATGEDVTYVRFAYAGACGEVLADRRLDEGIVRTLWMSAEQVRACTARHRSPLVLRCLEDHLAGRATRSTRCWPTKASSPRKSRHEHARARARARGRGGHWRAGVRGRAAGPTRVLRGG